MFQHQGNHIFKGATITGKNMYRIGQLLKERIAPHRVHILSFKSSPYENLKYVSGLTLAYNLLKPTL